MKTLVYLLIGMSILVISTTLPIYISAQEESAALPLAAEGPYGVGFQWMSFVDENRQDRQVQTAIWYPAIVPQGETEQGLTRGLLDAEPDSAEAPYPLILYSHGYGGNPLEAAYFNAHLASYGFVVAGMEHHCGNAPTCLTDRPLDVLYILDQLGQSRISFTDMIDNSIVGVAGYSDGAYTALALSGAQIDPEYFLSWYAEHQDDSTILSIDLWIPPWDEISDYRAQFAPPLEAGEMWPPFSDERIQAVMPMAPCYGPLFGEQGLAAAHVPGFLIGATNDSACSYERDAVFMYEHLGSEERYLLSLIDQGHLVGADPLFVDYFKHFSVAFFGFYLQGVEDYADYLTEPYIAGFDDLAWGAYEGN